MRINQCYRILPEISLLLVATQSFAAAQQSVQPKPDAQAIEKIIRNYILENPEVVLESVRGYDARVKEAELQRSRNTIKTYEKELYGNSPLIESADKASAPVTLVEFFDNRCGYCKQVDATVTSLTQIPGVRIVYKELPILGPESMLAAQAALAADKQGEYQKFHRALLTLTGPVTREALDRTAVQLGLNLPRFQKDMVSPETSAAVARNIELAEALGIKATPTFVIGEQMVSGALSADAFRALIDSARQPAAALQGGKGE